MNRGGAVPDGEDILRRARLFLMGSPGNGQGTYLILFSLSMIVVPRQEVSRLRELLCKGRLHLPATNG